MKSDWHAALISEHRDTARRSESLARQALAEDWYRFFDEVSVYATQAEAAGGPKQEIRDVYTGEVASGRDKSYSIPEGGLGLTKRLALGVIDETFSTALRDLPAYSWSLYFRFKLEKPYLSKDEAPFYVIDNPVRKDKVFRLPMVAATTWKGNLRAVVRQEEEVGTEEREREHAPIVRLFGNVKGEEVPERFRAGRLRFFPTFFTQIDLEVINPHSRESGAGEQPIYLECVPRGAEGIFALLYVPFDLLDEPQNDTCQEVATDLELCARGVYALMLRYGFGAKTSGGFGITESRITNGNLAIRTVARPLPFSFSFSSLRKMVILARAMADEINPGVKR